MQSNKDLIEKIIVLNDKEASYEDIAQNGEYFLTILYNLCTSSDKLNEIKYNCYKKL